MNMLIVGGTFDKNGGKSSGFVYKLTTALKNNGFIVDLFNGGNYEELHKLIKSTIAYESVIWMPNVPNDLPKIRNIKKINPKIMLIVSKNNIGNKYSFMDLTQRSLQVKANLMIEITKPCEKFNMRLLDPLGIQWEDTTDINKLAKSLTDRLTFISKVTRQSTFHDKNNNYINIPLSYNNEKNINTFLDIVKSYAPKFALAMAFGDKDKIERFLGNASFRCVKGFPSFRMTDNYILVSRRNVPKNKITIKDFVPVIFEKEINQIFYLGDNKPSVDTPVQVRLYELFPNINFMIHGHCYCSDTDAITKTPLPCGAIEEVDEIKKCIKKHFNNDFTKDFYCINLLGHGCIIMSKTPKTLKNMNFISRPQPEILMR